jgi:hypothetical protein
MFVLNVNMSEKLGLVRLMREIIMTTKNKRIPPVDILKEIAATAIVEVTEDIWGKNSQGVWILEQGATGWTTMIWGGESDFEWVTQFMIHPQFSGNVPFSWLSNGIEQCVFLLPEQLKIKKKLPAWKQICKNGCPQRT